MAHIEDRWWHPAKPPRLDARGQPVMEKTDRYGRGLRYVAQWVEDGQRRSKSCRTRDEALELLADVKQAQRDGTHVRADDTTVSQFAVRWFDSQVHRRKSSNDTAHSHWVNHIEPAFGRMPLQDVTLRHVQAAVGQWKTTQSPRSVRAINIDTSALFAAAVRERLIPRNPCDGVNLPRVERGHIIPLTVEQVWDVAYRMQPRYQALILIAAATGLRSAELRGLTLGDVKRTASHGTVRVRRQLVTTVPTFGPTKTDSSLRTVSIDAHALDVIDWHSYRVPPGREGLLFPAPDGTGLAASTIGARMRGIASDLDLPPRFGLHALRHFHASLLIAAGLSVTAVASRLGHKNSTETLQTYAHLWPDDEERARDAISAQLWR